jgi:hypothetical protein
MEYAFHIHLLLTRRNRNVTHHTLSVAIFTASLHSDPLSNAKVRDSTSCVGKNHTAKVSYGKTRININEDAYRSPFT